MSVRAVRQLVTRLVPRVTTQTLSREERSVDDQGHETTRTVQYQVQVVEMGTEQQVVVTYVDDPEDPAQDSLRQAEAEALEQEIQRGMSEGLEIEEAMNAAEASVFGPGAWSSPSSGDGYEPAPASSSSAMSTDLLDEGDYEIELANPGVEELLSTPVTGAVEPPALGPAAQAALDAYVTDPSDANFDSLVRELALEQAGDMSELLQDAVSTLETDPAAWNEAVELAVQADQLAHFLELSRVYDEASDLLPDVIALATERDPDRQPPWSSVTLDDLLANPLLYDQLVSTATARLTDTPPGQGPLDPADLTPEPGGAFPQVNRLNEIMRGATYVPQPNLDAAAAHAAALGYELPETFGLMDLMAPYAGRGVPVSELFQSASTELATIYAERPELVYLGQAASFATTSGTPFSFGPDGQPRYPSVLAVEPPTDAVFDPVRDRIGEIETLITALQNEQPTASDLLLATPYAAQVLLQTVAAMDPDDPALAATWDAFVAATDRIGELQAQAAESERRDTVLDLGLATVMILGAVAGVVASGGLAAIVVGAGITAGAVQTGRDVHEYLQDNYLARFNLGGSLDFTGVEDPSDAMFAITMAFNILGVGLDMATGLALLKNLGYADDAARAAAAAVDAGQVARTGSASAELLNAERVADLGEDAAAIFESLRVRAAALLPNATDAELLAAYQSAMRARSFSELDATARLLLRDASILSPDGLMAQAGSTLTRAEAEAISDRLLHVWQQSVGMNRTVDSAFAAGAISAEDYVLWSARASSVADMQRVVMSIADAALAEAHATLRSTLTAQEYSRLTAFVSSYVPDATQSANLYKLLASVAEDPNISGLGDWITYSMRAGAGADAAAVRAELWDDVSELLVAQNIASEPGFTVRVGNDLTPSVHPVTGDALPSFDLRVTDPSGDVLNIDVYSPGSRVDYGDFGTAINHARDKIITGAGGVPSGLQTSGDVQAALQITWPPPARVLDNGTEVRVAADGAVTFVTPDGRNISRGNFLEDYVDILNGTGRGAAPAGAAQIDGLTVFDSSGSVVYTYTRDPSTGLWTGATP